MSARRTRHAHTHVELVRRNDPDRQPTWSDVTAAFDAGVRFTLTSRRQAQREIYERDNGISPAEARSGT